MFGRIIEINDNILKVTRLKSEKELNILNFHVVFEEKEHKIVAEIIGITDEYYKMLLIGEIFKGVFSSGVVKKPSFNLIPRIILKSELELILGSQDVSLDTTLQIGTSFTYDNFRVTTNINEFLNNHFAIVGNTGSGKSCGVARLIQNLFDPEYNVPVNSHIVLFDAYGEYNSAFQQLDKVPGINYKNYTTELNFGRGELIKIPPYFLDTDDLALLLGATEAAQLPIIEKALNLCAIFTSEDEKVIQYKNSIIAEALLDILSSGKTPAQIRDQIVAVLGRFNTEGLNLESVISQPGYSRTIRQCLNIDTQGKMNAVALVVDHLEKYDKVEVNSIAVTKTIPYTLEDIYYALEFALISEGMFNSNTVYDKLNILKVRLKSIIDSTMIEYFKYPEFIMKESFIHNLFLKGNEPAQVVNMNFNYIDERFSKALIKVFAKLFYNYSTSLEDRTSYPIHMILEEAHRYVQNDSDIDIIGYNIFDRITKEGRKYGIILGFITQRPNELSKTALSQCSNFIAYRMYHPDDINVIASISANITIENVNKIKTLSPGVALVFGTAFKVPLITLMKLPDPMPQSTSVDIGKKWYKPIS